MYGSITVTVGQQVTNLTKIGRMGNTGNSFGTHLHLELTDGMAWANFNDPVTPLGIPNVRDTIVLWDSSGGIPNNHSQSKYKTPFKKYKKKKGVII